MTVSTPRSIFRNTVALFAARVTYLGGSMLLVSYLSRMLQAEGLGSYSTAMALFGLGELVCGLGLSNFIPRELGKDLSQTNRYVIHASILVSASALVVIAVLAGLASNLSYSIQTATSIYLISLALIPTALRVVLDAVFVCHQKAGLVTFTTLLWTIIKILISLYLLHREYGVVSLVLTFTAISFLSFLNSVLFYIKYVEKPRWEFDPALLKDIIRDLRAFILLAIGGSIFAQAETIILSFIKGETEVGFYSAALKLITVWYMIPQSYMVVVFPTLSRAYQQSPHRSQIIQGKSIKYLLSIALPLAAGGFAAASPIIELIYGAGFEKSVLLFRVIAWHTVLAFVNNVLWRVLLARDEQRLALRVQIISGVLRIGLSLLLIPWLDSLGAALALMGGYTVYTLLHVYYIRRGGTRLPLFRLGWRFALAAGIMGTFTFAFAQSLNLFVLIFLSILVYAGLVLLLRAFPQDDLDLFSQVWKRRKVFGPADAGAATADNESA